MSQIRRCGRVALLLAGAGLVFVPGLQAQTPMDTVAFNRLQMRLSSLERVRVVTDSSRIELFQPRLTVNGMTWSAARWLAGTADTARIEAPLPLERLRAIQVRRPAIATTVVIGMIAGGVAGAVGDGEGLGCSLLRRDGRDRRSFLGYVALGGAAGAISSLWIHRWQTIWPS